MKPQNKPYLLATLLCVVFTAEVRAQSTAFTYQGHLTQNGSPATGIYDLRFTIYDAAGGGGVVAGPLTNSPVAVSNGLFTVTLDFGSGVFDGTARWLEIAARTNGGGGFTMLSPRQHFASTPYAIRALTVGDGAVAGAYASQVSFSNPANEFTGEFTGDGSALSNVVATSLGTELSASFWQLGGNAATTPGVNFLGTTDNQPLELWVNNQRGLRLEYPTTGTVPNLIGGFSGNSVGSGTAGAVIGGGGIAFFPNTIGTNILYSVIGGGASNSIVGQLLAATIAGGFDNVIGVAASSSVIGGGLANRIEANSANATIAGGAGNRIDTNAQYPAIGGGGNNRIASGAWYSTIAGGANNDIRLTADISAIGGGANNVISTNSSYGTIAGGRLNVIAVDSDDSAIGGGNENSVNGLRGTVAGGSDNSVLGNDATIGGGFNNTAVANGATLAGGRNNLTQGSDSTIGGGLNNVTAATGATVAGGRNNRAQGGDSTVGGGNGNEALNTGANVAGGQSNTAESSTATVAGGHLNTAAGLGSFIGGGRNNQTASFYSVVSGGEDNVATFTHATVAGGQRGRATGNWSALGGGRDNTANGAHATVGGGNTNRAAGNFSVVGGGGDNVANGFYSTIGGGLSNAASGAYAAVPGGLNNLAQGHFSTAIGYRAKALHTGTFVWSDTREADFSSTTNSQFIVRAENGIGLGGPNSSLGFVEVQQPSNEGTRGLSVVNVSRARTVRLWVDGADKSHLDSGPGGVADLILNEGGGNVGIGKNNPATALDVNGTVTATAFNPSSDRNLKANFAYVDPAAVLERVAGLKITRWNFKGDDATPHLGPMAQDFHAAFQFNGDDDKHISTVDADGVALAAIQGLNQKLTEELKRRDAEAAALQARLVRLEQLLASQLDGGAK